MNYRFTFSAILIIIVCLLAFLGGPKVFGDTTQTNTSGSNTAIEGNYTSDSTTTYESGSESTSNTTSTKNSNIQSSPPSASAPSFNAMTQDVCAVGVSAGLQTFGFGVSGGKHMIDENCERLKLARILNDFGMKVAAVAILCQDERVFESMIQAGTPCPIDGKIGKEAKELWSKYDHERPDYKTYVKRMTERKKIEKKIAKELALAEKKRLKEEAKITKKLEKEKVILPKKKPLNWESPK